MKAFKSIVGVALILCAASANASLILNNNSALDISEFVISESFEDFYGYGDEVVSSSNTGYEMVNTAVFLVANFNNRLALIATFGSFVSEGDEEGGRLSLTLDNNGFGSFLFIDDSTDPLSVNSGSTTINFNYFTNRTDGFIFDLGAGDNVDLNIFMSEIKGVDNYVFLNSNKSSYLLDTDFSLSSLKVNAPSNLMLICLSLLLLASRKLRS